MEQKRDIESLHAHNVISLSSREFDSDSGHESDPGDEVNAESREPQERHGRNAGRPKAKTADELDAEMVDYFDANAVNGAAGAEATNGATAPAANGDAGMEEISGCLESTNIYSTHSTTFQVSFGSKRTYHSYAN